MAKTTHTEKIDFVVKEMVIKEEMFVDAEDGEVIDLAKRIKDIFDLEDVVKVTVTKQTKKEETE